MRRRRAHENAVGAGLAPARGCARHGLSAGLAPARGCARHGLSAGLAPARGCAGTAWRKGLLGAVLSLALLSPSTAWAQTTRIAEIDLDEVESVNISVTVRSRFSPYERVRYELRSRGSTIIAALTKTLAGGYGELQSISLLSDEAFALVVSDLAACGFDQIEEPRPEVLLAHHPEARGLGATWDVAVRLGDTRHAISLHEHEIALSSPFWCSAQRIIAAYESIGEPVPFENAFFDEGQFGELTTNSTPGANIFIDGVDSGLHTPVQHYRLSPGVHIIRFVNTELGIDREYDVTIVEGHTTRLIVELR